MGWAAEPAHNRAPAHWAVTAAAGIPFGAGYLLLFMAMLNYLVDAYCAFSSSALAASSTSRSAVGAALPLATHAMYGKLGIAWACTVLGAIAFALGWIPLVYMRYGPWVKRRSAVWLELIEEEAKGQEARGEPIECAEG